LTGRPLLWQAGFAAFLDHPLFGVTRENLYDHVERHLIAPGWRADLAAGGVHNGPLTVLICSGAIGFALLAGFFLYLTRRLVCGLLRSIKANCAVKTDRAVNANRVVKSDCAVGAGDGKYPHLVVAAALFVLIAVTELTEARILYQVNVFNVFFWTVCGYGATLAGGGCR
jgi:O-antigen ligase